MAWHRSVFQGLARLFSGHTGLLAPRLLLGAALLLWLAPAPGQALTVVSFKGLGTFDQPVYTAVPYGPTVSGSANVQVNNFNGLGIVGGSSNNQVDYIDATEETITLELGFSASHFDIIFGSIVGNTTANVHLTGYDGASYLGSAEYNLFSLPGSGPDAHRLNLNTLFGSTNNVSQVTIQPLNSNFESTGTGFSISSVAFVPEPSSALLLGLGLAGLGTWRQSSLRRKKAEA